MIIESKDLPLSFQPASKAPCPGCHEDTANLCGRCGRLKTPSLHHVGALSRDVEPIVAGRSVSWKTFHAAVALGTLGGFIMGWVL